MKNIRIFGLLILTLTIPAFIINADNGSESMADKIQAILEKQAKEHEYTLNKIKIILAFIEKNKETFHKCFLTQNSSSAACDKLELEAQSDPTTREAFESSVFHDAKSKALHGDLTFSLQDPYNSLNDFVC